MKVIILVIVILGLFGAFSYGQEILVRLQGKSVYDVEEATPITYNNLTPDTKAFLSKEDVRLILDLEFEFQREVGMTGEKPKKEVKEYTVEATKFIIQEGKKKGKNFTNKQISDVLVAEEVYLQKLGVLEKK